MYPVKRKLEVPNLDENHDIVSFVFVIYFKRKERVVYFLTTGEEYEINRNCKESRRARKNCITY